MPGTTGVFSIIDASRLYLASVISKPGRNEVQFYPLRTSSSQNETPSIRRIELHIDAQIVDVTWLNDAEQPAASPKKSAKRKADENPAENGHAAHQNGTTPAEHKPSAQLLLAVAFDLGEVLALSPMSDAHVGRFTCAERAVGVTRSTQENHVWVLSESAKLHEVHATSGEPGKTLNLAKTDAELLHVRTTLFRPKNRPQNDTDPLLLASSTLFLVDARRARKNVVAEFAGDDKPIALVLGVASDASLALVARENSSTVEVFDLADSSQPPQKFECTSSLISGICGLGPDHFVVFTARGAEVFALSGDAQKPVGQIVTSHPDIQLENMYVGADGVVGVWYDGNQPRFVAVSENALFDGPHTVAIDARERASGDDDDEAPDITFTAVESTEIDNLPSAQLFKELSAQLTKKKVLSGAVVQLCQANDNEDNIKETVRHLSRTDQCLAMVDALFRAVSARVAEDPSRRLSLSIWLKWLLLLHGNYIARQPALGDSTRRVQQKLSESLALMAKLLALQGRLQLLKAQAELRSRVAQNDESGDDDEAEERAMDTLNDTYNTTGVEESVVYANGENDDDEFNGHVSEAVFEDGEE